MGDLAVADAPMGETAERRRWPILTVAVAMAVVLHLQSSPAGADTERVRLEDRRFSPESIEISVGDTVVWRARDDGHTVTAANGAFDSGRSGLLRDGDEFRWRFVSAGTYPYFCRVHQENGMEGEVVVLGDAADRVPGSSATTSRPPPSVAEGVAEGVAAPAPSTTTTTAQPSTTTTSRPLATSSTVNLATTTTRPGAAPVIPQEPPALDPDLAASPSAEGSGPDSRDARRRPGDAGSSSPTRVGLMAGLPAALAAAAATLLVWRRRRRSPGGPA